MNAKEIKEIGTIIIDMNYKMFSNSHTKAKLILNQIAKQIEAKIKEEAEERYEMAEAEATKYATHKEKIGDGETNVYDVRVKLAFMRGAKCILAAFGKGGKG